MRQSVTALIGKSLSKRIDLLSCGICGYVYNIDLSKRCPACGKGIGCSKVSVKK